MAREPFAKVTSVKLHSATASPSIPKITMQPEVRNGRLIKSSIEEVDDMKNGGCFISLLFDCKNSDILLFFR